MSESAQGANLKVHWRTAFGCAGLLAFVGILLVSVRWGSRGRETPRPEQRVVASGLKLQDFRQVRGTDVFRATLSDGSGSYSGGYGRARNLLFVEANGDARWLVADDDHVLEEHALPASTPRSFDGEPAPVAMVVLAKTVSGEPRTGDLYLSDPLGRRVQRIAQGVREVDGVALSSDGVAAVLYEGAGGYVLAHYALPDFRMLREVNVAVPALK
jgi:hypothetical protein